MNLAAAAAPEIDRLVLSVSEGVVRTHGASLVGLARERGLDSLEFLPHLGDFLLADALTRELAMRRLPYAPPERVGRRLDELADKQLIQQRGPALGATDAMRPLLEALITALADVAVTAWRGHEEDVGTASRLAWEIAQAASDDHVVAVVHRAIPQPADPYLRLHRNLVTLRYVRQHDHVMAWRARDLSAPAMMVMTQLWQGGAVDGPGEGLTRLVELGFAIDDPPALTTEGRVTRDAIEDDTNARARETFDVPGEDAAATFLEAVRRLPGREEPSSPS